MAGVDVQLRLRELKEKQKKYYMQLEDLQKNYMLFVPLRHASNEVKLSSAYMALQLAYSVYYGRLALVMGLFSAAAAFFVGATVQTLMSAFLYFLSFASAVSAILLYLHANGRLKDAQNSPMFAGMDAVVNELDGMFNLSAKVMMQSYNEAQNVRIELDKVEKEINELETFKPATSIVEV